MYLLANAPDTYVPDTYVDQTTLTPAAVALLVPLCAIVLFGRRSYALGALLAVICVVPTAQRITILGADFDPLRILLVCGFIRVIMRSELAGLKWHAIDAVFACYVCVAYLAYCILHQFQPAAVIYRTGAMFTLVGAYIQSRCYLRSRDDVVRCARILAVLAIPICGLFIVEWLTGRNLFSSFGGVPAVTQVRFGRLRCQGAYAHPILAGCFWAGALPIIAMALFGSKKWRPLAIAGVISALLIVVCCSSSTPVMMVVVIVVAAAAYFIRSLVPAITTIAALLILIKHVAGNTPAWHLISRIDLVGGSTGWHRYYLIDQAVKRFSEWWLVGTRSTAHWGRGLFDVTNQYILEGVQGGALVTALYALILVLALKRLIPRGSSASEDAQSVIWRWCLGCALVAHAAAFFAVAYFGPVLIIYWSTIAACVAMNESEEQAQLYWVFSNPIPPAVRAEAQGTGVLT
jgi:hypothetical protein